MKNKKQYLIGETIQAIKKTEEEIKKSNEELEILEAKLKVENKFLQMKDIKEELKEDVKYTAQAIGDMIVMEKNKNKELNKELQILLLKKQVINKFEERDL